jgi:hypothetical protein
VNVMDSQQILTDDEIRDALAEFQPFLYDYRAVANAASKKAANSRDKEWRAMIEKFRNEYPPSLEYTAINALLSDIDKNFLSKKEL